MKVVFTDAAVDDLRSIAAYLAANYPSVAATVERRLRIVIARSRDGQRAHNGSLNAQAFVSSSSFDTPTESSIGSPKKRLRYYTSITRRDRLPGRRTANGREASVISPPRFPAAAYLHFGYRCARMTFRSPPSTGRACCLPSRPAPGIACTR